MICLQNYLVVSVSGSNPYFRKPAPGHLESHRVSNIESISSITWSLVIVGFSTDFISNISIASLAILFLLTMSKSATITVSSSIPAHLLFQSLLSWNSLQDKYILLFTVHYLGATHASVARGGKGTPSTQGRFGENDRKGVNSNLKFLNSGKIKLRTAHPAASRRGMRGAAV